MDPSPRKRNRWQLFCVFGQRGQRNLAACRLSDCRQQWSEAFDDSPIYFSKGKSWELAAGSDFLRCRLPPGSQLSWALLTSYHVWKVDLAIRATDWCCFCSKWLSVYLFVTQSQSKWPARLGYRVPGLIASFHMCDQHVISVADVFEMINGTSCCVRRSNFNEMWTK